MSANTSSTSSAVDNNLQVKLTVKELKNRLKYLIENNRYLQSKGKNPIAASVEGLSGLGKTSTIIQLAKEMNLNFVKINLAQIEELGDLVGFPIRQFEMCKNKECLWIDEPAVHKYESEEYKFTGKNRMGYCPPFWIANNQESGGILFLDDWTRADLRFVQAVMELIDRQTYISWTLPKDWHIILSANPDNGEYLVQSIDDAQRTRFLSFELIFNKDCWAEWAELEQIDGRCINFLLRHPELVKGKTNPRSITNFFNSISSLKSFSDSDSLALINDFGEGSVGVEFTSLFTTFIHNKLDLLITPEQIFDTKVDVKNIIDKLNNTFNTKDSNGKTQVRADIASIIATRVVNYCYFRSENKDVNSDFIKRLVEILKSKTFTEDLTFLICKRVYNKDTKSFAPMLRDQDLTKYII